MSPGRSLTRAALTEQERRLLATLRWARGPVAIPDLAAVLWPAGTSGSNLRQLVRRLRDKLIPGIAVLAGSGRYRLESCL